MDNQDPKSRLSDRRAFLQKCGRFAIVTPPAISVLLSTSLTRNAIAKSSGEITTSLTRRIKQTLPKL
jgi:hypothetical protein